MMGISSYVSSYIKNLVIGVIITNFGRVVKGGNWGKLLEVKMLTTINPNRNYSADKAED